MALQRSTRPKIPRAPLFLLFLQEIISGGSPNSRRNPGAAAAFTLK
jgi:hypothetical protein